MQSTEKQDKDVCEGYHLEKVIDRQKSQGPVHRSSGAGTPALKGSRIASLGIQHEYGIVAETREEARIPRAGLSCLRTPASSCSESSSSSSTPLRSRIRATRTRDAEVQTWLAGANLDYACTLGNPWNAWMHGSEPSIRQTVGHFGLEGA